MNLWSVKPTMSYANRFIFNLLVLLLLLGCQSQHPALGQTIAKAQEELTESLISLAGVQGTGIGEYEGRPCINVMVVRKTQDLLDRIPTTYEGFPVVVIETGELRIHEEDRP